jgi:phosphoglycolate phosphatase-like HAD superfamily hydrolase
MSSAPPVLIVWDIDGTLISDPGSHQLRFEQAVGRLLGRDDVAPPGPTDGGTDHGILARLLLREGFTEQQTALLVPPALHELEAITTDPVEITAQRRVLPGVPEALDALRGLGAIQSFVTGNSRRRAVAKLGAFGLDEVLDVRCGGFGDRTAERWRLVDEARRRAGLLHAADEDGVALERTYVIGDTIHDVAAGKDAGARSVAVATGAFTVGDLEPARPDLLLEDLEAGLEQLLELVAVASST